MRVYDHSQALIIKSTDYGEADKLVTVFSEQQGKLRAIARGIKKPKSSLRACVQPFCHSLLYFYRGRELDLITQGRLVEFFGNSRENLQRTLYSVYLMELLDKSLMDRMPMPELFRLTLNLLQSINEQGVNPLMIRCFEMALAIQLGYRPVLHQCVSCGSSQNLVRFCLAEGGMICSNCVKTIQAEMIPLSGESLALLRRLDGANLGMLSRVRVSGTAQQQVEFFLEQYLQYYLDRQFKMKETIRRLKPPG